MANREFPYRCSWENRYQKSVQKNKQKYELRLIISRSISCLYSTMWNEFKSTITCQCESCLVGCGKGSFLTLIPVAVLGHACCKTLPYDKLTKAVQPHLDNLIQFFAPCINGTAMYISLSNKAVPIEIDQPWQESNARPTSWKFMTLTAWPLSILHRLSSRNVLRYSFFLVLVFSA